MPITITRAKFKADTAKSFPNYRSKRMDLVLSCFRAYERDTGNLRNLGLLRAAVENWIVADPKEFANRSQVLSAIARLPPLPAVAQVRRCAEITSRFDPSECARESSSSASRLHSPLLKVLRCSLEDVMLGMNRNGESGNTGVIVIDMQAKIGHSLRDGATVYNGLSVIGNQATVLEAAAAYGMHVFEIRIAKHLNAKESDDGPETRVFHNDPTLPELTDVMATVKSANFVSIAKPFYNSFQGTALDDELRTRGITQVIVMGFDANLCVRNTIFGTPAATEYTEKGKVDAPYLGGLLDRGIVVFTSRVVLASSHGARLETDYGMTG